MKIEIEPEIILAGIKYLEGRREDGADRWKAGLDALAPVLAQLMAQGSPFGSRPRPDSAGDQPH